MALRRDLAVPEPNCACELAVTKGAHAGAVRLQLAAVAVHAETGLVLRQCFGGRDDSIYGHSRLALEITT